MNSDFLVRCPQLVPIGTRTTRHFNKGYVCMYVLNLLEGQVKFFGKFKLQKNCNQCCSSKFFGGYLKDSWASTYLQQLAQMASGKTDFFCTLKSFFCDGFYGFVSVRIPALNISVTEKLM